MSHAAGKRLIAPTVAALVGLAVLVSLGFWQWQRKAWKEELLATIDARLAAQPLPPQHWASLRCRSLQEASLEASCEFVGVRLRGRFDHGNERHIFATVPRAAIGPGGPGYWVFTPFELEDAAGGRIFVNRGFVPEPLKDPATRRPGQVPGFVEISAQIRTAELRGLFTAANDPAANVWFLRSPRELLGIAAGLPTPSGWQSTGPDPLMFYVEQIAPAPPGGLPAPRPARIDIPNRHLEYALTWWGLALTLIGVYAAFVASQLRQRPRAS